MKTIIYYFSGTGNSLKVARDIAEKIGAKIVPVASVVNDNKIKPDADVVVLVFPVYYVVNDGMPLIVSRFIRKLEGLENKYIFAVCTCNGPISPIITTLKRLIKLSGGTLACGFITQMPMSYATYGPTSIKMQRKMFTEWNHKLKVIAEYVRDRKAGKYETISPWINYLLTPLGWLIKRKLKNDFNKLVGTVNLDYPELIPLLDRIFSANDKCDGCGICARICPVKNIEINSKKPVWQHRCENCFACVQWCPKNAIMCRGGIPRNMYHHPEIKLEDMLNQTSPIK